MSNWVNLMTSPSLDDFIEIETPETDDLRKEYQHRERTSTFYSKHAHQKNWIVILHKVFFTMSYSAMSASESFSTRFPLKLWRLLSRCTSGAISWAEHGRSVKIDRRRFEREYLMPVDSAFKTSNFSSFVRQLNLYGFRKVINTFRFNQSTETFAGEVDIHEYHHPFFRRGHPDLLNRVQRRMKGRKLMDGRSDFENENPALGIGTSVFKQFNQPANSEQFRYNRPGLRLLNINGQLVPSSLSQEASTRSGCGSIFKPLVQTTIPNASTRLSTGPLAGLDHTPILVSSHNRPAAGTQQSGSYSLQTSQPTIHPGMPVVEALQKVLGEKTLSEIVQANCLSPYTAQPQPLLPVISAICSPTQTSVNSQSAITSETFLSRALSGQSAFSLKSASLQPMGSSSVNSSAIPTLYQSFPPGNRAGNANSGIVEITNLSDASIPDSLLPHIVNICPPMQSFNVNPAYILSAASAESHVGSFSNSVSGSISAEGLVSESCSQRNSPETNMSSIEDLNSQGSQTASFTGELTDAESSSSGNPLVQVMDLQSASCSTMSAENSQYPSEYYQIQANPRPQSKAVASNMNFPRRIEFPMESTSDVAKQPSVSDPLADASHFLRRLSNGGYDGDPGQEQGYSLSETGTFCPANEDNCPPEQQNFYSDHRQDGSLSEQQNYYSDPDEQPYYSDNEHDNYLVEEQTNCSDDDEQDNALPEEQTNCSDDEQDNALSEEQENCSDDDEQDNALSEEQTYYPYQGGDNPGSNQKRLSPDHRTNCPDLPDEGGGQENPRVPMRKTMVETDFSVILNST